jgi:hypothetical protein
VKSDDPDFVEQLLDTAQRIAVQPGMAASNSGRACLAALSFFACHRRDSHTVQNRFGHALTQSWRTFSVLRLSFLSFSIASR